MKSYAFLIDSCIYIFRYYFSARPSHLSEGGSEVSTVLAFSEWLLRLLNNEKPEHCAACFDESLHSGFRHRLDANYKRNRSLPDEALAYQLAACQQVAALCGVVVFKSQRFEADDLIAALARCARANALEPVIISRDKDLGQLLQPGSGVLWDYSFADKLDYQAFSEAFLIAPERVAEYLAIAGDSGDSIEGLRGIGKKTVAALFQHLPSWQSIKQDFSAVAELDIRASRSLAKKLELGQAQVEHNLKLTRLRDDSLELKLLQINKQKPDKQSLANMFDMWRAPRRLYSLMDRLC
ncbi:5'-3' exonuclease [Agaribacterium haliotis]|uniref:5'-3' exonuclease n=1 Tax=Agaribacterium haliotis TaxID=2013869 RepID=UPI000BB57401|nr:5'-3' exonuclease H3TH domain-containing protein [Agaribacterium haliotis]